MIVIKDSDTDGVIGMVSEADLQFIIDQLEEESEEDQDYWVDRDTLALLADHGAPAELTAMLETAIGERDGVEIVWAEE